MLTARLESQPSQLQSTGPDSGHRTEEHGEQLSLKRSSGLRAQISHLDHAPTHSHVFVRDATDTDLGRICWPQPSQRCTAQPPRHCHSPQCSYPGNSPPPMGKSLLGHRARFTGWKHLSFAGLLQCALAFSPGMVMPRDTAGCRRALGGN